MLKILASKSFKKSYTRLKKRGYDLSLLTNTIQILANDINLPPKYKDHYLQGNYKGYRECHIQPDWLLIYKISEDKLILVLADTGTHSDLF